jgi:hypothetical protein
MPAAAEDDGDRSEVKDGDLGVVPGPGLCRNVDDLGGDMRYTPLLG